jgi:hypothetical protein
LSKPTVANVLCANRALIPGNFPNKVFVLGPPFGHVQAWPIGTIGNPEEVG